MAIAKAETNIWKARQRRMKGTIVQQTHRYEKCVRHTSQKQQYAVEKPTVMMPYARVESNRLRGSRDTAARQASAILAIRIQYRGG